MRPNSLLILFVLSLLLVSSPSFAQDGNAVLTKCADEGTTYDKTKCRGANVGKVFSFKGRVFDVKDATTLTIQISNGNYADVVFRSNVGDTAKKDQVLSFRGRLARIGTGIMVNHDINDASLREVHPQEKTQGIIVKGNTKSTKECKTMYQGWVFNNMVEIGCGFHGGIAEKALKIAKHFCPNITEKQQDEWETPVGAALKKDFNEFGLDGQCGRYKPGYDALSSK